MVVPVIPWQPWLHVLERQLRQDGNPVETLLAVDGDVVSEIFERLARKRLIVAFLFLQPDDVVLSRGQPSDRIVHALLD